MKINKSVSVSIASIGILGLFSYFKFKKLMEYAISFNKIANKKIKIDNANFDLFINFLNKSDLQLTILSQQYLVYLNNVFIAKIINNQRQLIKPLSQSIIKVNVNFNPLDAVQNLTKQFYSKNEMMLNVKAILRIRILVFVIPISFDYQTTLKELLSTQS